MKKVAAALLLVPATMMVVSCSRPPEQQFLTQFFRAARGRDAYRCALGRSTVGGLPSLPVTATRSFRCSFVIPG
mgnify:CR=1 FL=1